MFLSEAEAREAAERILAKGVGDACEVSLSGGDEKSLRFARGGATTNISARDVDVRISVHRDGRVGSASAASLDEAALDTALTQANDIAALLPQDPDHLPPLGPQLYAPTRRFDPEAARRGFPLLVESAGAVMDEARRFDVDAFGCASLGRYFKAMATSAGLFAYDRRSEVGLSATARNRADDWSGWAACASHGIDGFEPQRVGARACAKAAAPQSAVDLEPGRYRVILEPAATAELARWLVNMMNARAADEGRGFFAAAGGGDRIGEAVFHPSLTIVSDPADAIAPQGAIGFEGVPNRRRVWVENGVVRELYRSRFWARRSNAEPVPHPRSFAMAGGASSLEEMIRATPRGVLVTRLWYTNMVDPRSLLLTGLTRDGNFLIENGRVVAPARNLRFNESLASIFTKIEALGASERVAGGAGGGGFVAAPPMMVGDFDFASRSSGI